MELLCGVFLQREINLATVDRLDDIEGIGLPPSITRVPDTEEY